MKNLKFNSKSIVQTKARWLLTFCALLTIGVGQMWADCPIGNIGYVDFYNTVTNSRYALTNDDGNHYYGSLYVAKNTTYDCKFVIGKLNDWGPKWYRKDQDAVYTWSGNWGPGLSCLREGGDNDHIQIPNSGSAYKKLYIDFWGSYKDGWTGPRIKFLCEDVDALSASLSADATSVQGGSTTTVRGGCSGGSGSYGYSYTVTCGGSDVTATVLSGSGANRTFTAPQESTSKTYRVTITATEQNSQLTGLGFTGSNSKYVDITVPGITAPTVTMTVDKVNVNQITLTGTITAYNGYGSNASDLSEVGFYIGATKYIATYKSGNTFTKTITGLSANTAHANVKAFATNPLATGNSGTQTVTTLADAEYKVKVRVAHGSAAPKVYAWTDADSYGGSKMENGSYGSQSASEDKFEATTYDWYTYELNNKYENFLIYRTGDSDKSGDFPATRVSDCYWYNPSSSPRAKQMTCPEFEPQIVIHDGSTETMYEMTGGSTTVTKSQSLTAGTYYIKVMYNTEYYGKSTNYSNTIARTGSTTSNAISSMVVDEGYINLTADLAGTYTFSFNTSTKTLSVTYPEAYQVTFSKSIVGSDNSTISEPTASYSSGAVTVTSATTWIPTGTTVNFSAPDATIGYTWKGWYSVADPSANWSSNRLATTAAYSPTINSSAVKTIYAVYEEDDYTVTVNASPTTGGSITTPSGSGSTVTAHVSTTAAIVASLENVAWHFAGWTTESGSASFGSSSSLSTTVNATETSTVQANFVPRYGLIGSRKGAGSDIAEGMPNHEGTTWQNEYAADFEVVSFTALGEGDGKGVDLECTRTLYPNRDYKFQVYDRTLGTRRGCDTGNDGEQMDAGENWQLNGTKDIYISTAGYGNYTFKITNMSNDVNLYPSIEIVRPSSHQLTFGWEDVDIDGNTNTTSRTNYGQVTARTNEGAGFDIATSKFFADGSSITFTATPVTGYTLEGWYTNSDYAVGNKISNGGVYSIGENTLTVSSVSDNLSIYAKFVENSTSVTIKHNEHGHVTIGGVIGTSTTTGVTTTRTITAVPEAGYYFAGWTLSDGADFSVADASGASDNNSKSTTLTGLGAGTTGTLTAVFEENSKIYFRNVFDDGENPVTHWSNVYVYFGVDWHSDQGVHKTGGMNEYAQMQPVAAGSYTYWAYIPHAYKDWDKIAFADADFHGYYSFDGNNGVYRSDYNPALNMFVPHHLSSGTTVRTTYFSNGYWMNYGEAGSPAGYYIMRYTGSGYENPADNGTGSNQFVIIDENTIQYSLRIDNSSVTHNRFRITSAYGTQYITTGGEEGTAITTDNCDNNLVLSEFTTGSPRFSINQTIHGIYVITIDQSGDAMKIRVNYPVALNDYRLKHTYTGRNKANTADSTYITYSGVIKNGSTNVIVSMFINTTSTPTLALEKCTNIDPLTWTDQSAGLTINTGTNYFDDGNGVYQFNIASPGTDNTLSNIKLYDGEFYIKTDIASGGWTAYKANIMEKNSITFDSGDPKTFDYAFCHWVGKARSTGSATNVKCVIANDYNIAVSDTLEHDAIIGDGANKYQTLPSPAHVRFSYNSTTNELKRTYLAVTGDDHLVMEGNTLSGPVYMIKNTSEVEFTDNKATLENQSNFTFGLDIKARETARVRLSAKYNGTIQDLVGHVTSYGNDLTDANTVQIMGGNSSNTGYNSLRVSYDFKTNQLLSAWMAPSSGTTADQAINADVMIIREEQGNARQITFSSGSDKLSAVKKAYGVMKFTKSFITDNTQSRYKRDLYWISFPFDVKLSDAFGLGTYGTHWIIEYYDGVGRARNGFWADSEPNWKFVTPYMREHGGEDGQGYILNANEGYILALDLDELGGESLVWDNGMTEAYLYFPSNDDVVNIQNTTAVVDLGTPADYYCSINRGTTDGDRRVKDSYWHCIGVPSFAEASSSNITSDGEATIVWQVENGSLPFLYQWQGYTTGENTLEVVSTSGGSSFTFQPMYSYLVQYNQQYMHWSAVTNHASVAARITETPDKEYKLVLSIGEEEQDKAMLRLTDKEGVTNRFEFNQDLSKEYNAGKANIWTVTADTVEVAGNSMPKPVQTTVVPVGVKVVANGEYTFSMPEGTNGENVVLIDNAYGTRTNLGLMPYTVTLTAGTYDSRFALEFAPIQDAPTGIEQMSTVNYQLSTEEVRKVFVGGRLYIIRDGKVFDATGHRVE